jgi:tetratricopeptide (TPR) repeat protein
MSNTEAQLDLAWKLFKTAKYAEAADILSSIIATDANVPSAYSKRARCYHRMGNPDQALSDLSRAIELSPRSAAYYFTRGRYYFEIGEFHKAHSDFTNVLGLEEGKAEQPFLESALFFRADVNCKLKRFEDALKDCSKIRNDFSLYVLRHMRTRDEVISDAMAGLKNIEEGN